MFAGILGFLGLAGIANSFFSTANANSIAQQTSAEESQILHEAHLQQAQEEGTPGLIAQRNSQETLLNPATDQYRASGTLLGNLAAAEAKQPTETTTTTPKALLGV